MIVRAAILGVFGLSLVGCASSGTVACPRSAADDSAGTTVVTAAAVTPQVVSRPDPSYRDPSLQTWGAALADEDEDYGF